MQGQSIADLRPRPHETILQLTKDIAPAKEGSRWMLVEWPRLGKIATIAYLPPYENEPFGPSIQCGVNLAIWKVVPPISDLENKIVDEILSNFDPTTTRMISFNDRRFELSSIQLHYDPTPILHSATFKLRVAEITGFVLDGWTIKSKEYIPGTIWTLEFNKD
jgi:hypothetical protein